MISVRVFFHTHKALTIFPVALPVVPTNFPPRVLVFFRTRKALATFPVASPVACLVAPTNVCLES